MEKHQPLSKKRQRRLLRMYPDGTYFGMDVLNGKITKEDGYFLMVHRVLHSKYANPMSMAEFFNKINP